MEENLPVALMGLTILAIALHHFKAPVPKRMIWVLGLFPFALFASSGLVHGLLDFLCGDCRDLARFLPVLFALGLAAYLIGEFMYHCRQT